MIRWTGLAPWEFEFPFPGSLTSTFRETGDREAGEQAEELQNRPAGPQPHSSLEKGLFLNFGDRLW